ncbi:hypothetical protein ACJIZ3_020828 [Penstemon smallii]|uniref:Small ribosomal subunit protein mS35 mitochondrial conserved domain-containing protein n=1 Tax=Penstemon smallii TaxID=265156 RepID=A0ABD3SJR4_9LAMI
MRGALLRNFTTLYTRNLHLSHNLKPRYIVSNNSFCSDKYITGNAPLVGIFPSSIRLFSSENETPDPDPKPESETSRTPPEEKKEAAANVEDVSNKELKVQIEDYLHNFNEEALPSILESILKRKLSGKHEDTDDELLEELRMEPLDDVKDTEFESDFEEAYETDNEIDNLYSTQEIAIKKMTDDDPYFNMDDTKWDDMIKEAIEHGHLKDTKECEDILEDMLNWDKLLPDEIKKKVEEKFNEIGDRVEKGELEVEEGYALFKEFEDQMVLECAKLMDAEAPSDFDDVVYDDRKELDDPPGEGPILRWETRIVFAPGGDAWHPKNRKVKLAVSVKELELSKHQFVRLRELAGKRYNPGKDELMITSERFEHREENRKDCLRTLYSLIDEARKAKKLVDEARTSDLKERLKANPKFMQRLQAKTTKSDRI